MPETLKDSINISEINHSRGLCNCTTPLWKDDVERILCKKDGKRLNKRYKKVQLDSDFCLETETKAIIRVHDHETTKSADTNMSLMQAKDDGLDKKLKDANGISCLEALLDVEKQISQ